MERIQKVLATVRGGFRALLIGEREGPVEEPAAFSSNQQMLLPGIAEPYRLQAVEEHAAGPAGRLAPPARTYR